MTDEDLPPVGRRPCGPLALLDNRVRSLGCAGCGACCEEIILTWDPRKSETPFVRAHWHVEWVQDGARTDERGTIPAATRYVVTCDAYDPVHRRCTAHAERPPVCSDYPHYFDPPTSTSRADRRAVRDQDGAMQPYGCSYGLDSPGWSKRGRPLIPVEVLRG